MMSRFYKSVDFYSYRIDSGGDQGKDAEMMLSYCETSLNRVVVQSGNRDMKTVIEWYDVDWRQTEARYGGQALNVTWYDPLASNVDSSGGSGDGGG